METLVLIALIFFLTATTRSVFGFGGALVAMPLLTLVVPIATATPLFGLIGMVLSISLSLWHRQDISFEAGKLLIVGALVGMPIGIWLLIDLPERVVVGVLGALLIVFGVNGLRQPVFERQANRQWAYVAGFVSGSLGSAFNTAGPPIVAFGMTQQWPPQKFRATLHGYFLFVQTAIALAQGAAGLWTRTVWVAFGWALPAMFLGMVAGNWLAGRISAENYNKIVYIVIILLGILLLSRAI